MMERTPFNDWLTLFAAVALATLTGLVAGAIFAGEAGTFREWISALSGWVAGIGAVGVGVFTIRPLVRQVQIQEHAAKTTIIANAYEAVDRINDSIVELNRLSTFITLPERFIPLHALEASRKSDIIRKSSLKLRQATANARTSIGNIIISNGSIFANDKRMMAINSTHSLDAWLMEVEFVADIYKDGAADFDASDRQLFWDAFADAKDSLTEMQSCFSAYEDALETLL